MAEEQRSKKPTWRRLAMLCIGGFAIGIFVYAIYEHYRSDSKGSTRPPPLLTRLRGINNESVMSATVSQGTASATLATNTEPAFSVLPSPKDTHANSGLRDAVYSETMESSPSSDPDGVLVDTHAPASSPQPSAPEDTLQDNTFIDVLRPRDMEVQETDAFRIAVLAVGDGHTTELEEITDFNEKAREK